VWYEESVNGRNVDFSLQDLWIACQAIQYGIKVLTRNEKDIPGLDLVIFESG